MSDAYLYWLRNKDKVLKYISRIIPLRIPKGHSLTVDDVSRSIDLDLPRVSRVTAKYALKDINNLFEVIGVNKDSTTGYINYTVFHSHTNTQFIISKTKFEKMFNRI